MEQRVLVSSPVNLLALLRAVAFGWQEHEMSQQAREIAEQAMELYRRFVSVLGHVRSTGDSLGRAVAEYNKLVGSVQSRVLPAARRLEEYADKELPDARQLETDVREVEWEDGQQEWEER